jgi:hypothetical protein
MRAGGDVEHGEMVEKELDAFIERRGRDAKRSGKDEALEEMWRASERRHKERLRRANAALWYEFHMRLCEAHAAISERHEARALALLEEPAARPRSPGDPMSVG